MSKKNALVFLFIFLLIIFGVLYGFYLYKPVSLSELTSVDGMIHYAKSFGILMPVFIFVITAIQAIIPGVPFAVLCSASGILFGLLKGMVMIWAATLFGAAVLFYISRKLGYGWAEKFMEKYKVRGLQKLEGEKGFITILVLRLLPYFPAPVINISAGISNVKFSSFFLASAIGKLPFIIAYTLLGYSILKKGNYLLGSILLIFVIILPYLYVSIKQKKKKTEETEQYPEE